MREEWDGESGETHGSVKAAQGCLLTRGGVNGIFFSLGSRGEMRLLKCWRPQCSRCTAGLWYVYITQLKSGFLPLSSLWSLILCFLYSRNILTSVLLIIHDPRTSSAENLSWERREHGERDRLFGSNSTEMFLPHTCNYRTCTIPAHFLNTLKCKAGFSCPKALWEDDCLYRGFNIKGQL